MTYHDDLTTGSLPQLPAEAEPLCKQQQLSGQITAAHFAIYRDKDVL